jgi:hypothetical protein
MPKKQNNRLLGFTNFVIKPRSFLSCRRCIWLLQPTLRRKRRTCYPIGGGCDCCTTPQHDNKVQLVMNTSSNTKSVHTAESRAKISAARKGQVPWNKGRNHSKETREKISHTLRVKMADPKIREALRERQLGKMHSAMTRLRIRLSSKKSHPKSSWIVEGKGPLPYFFSRETIARVNQRIFMNLSKYRKAFPQVTSTRQNRKLSVLFGIEPPKPSSEEKPKAKLTKSEETKRRIAESIRAKWKDMEYRSKVIEAAKSRPGKPIGEETKRKISQSLRNYYMIMGKSSSSSSMVGRKKESRQEQSNSFLFRNQLDRKQRKQQLAEMLRKQMEQLSMRLRSKQQPQEEEEESNCNNSAS